MESLNKKPSTPISFAAIAGKTPIPTAFVPTSSVASGTAPSSKNGSNAPSGQSSPALRSQSPAAAPPASTTPGPGPEKPSASAPPSSSGSIDWIVGMNVKVVTQADEVFEGQVYAYDLIMNCLCLSSKSSSASSTPVPGTYYSPSLGNNNNSSSNASRLKYDFRILKINYIKEVMPLGSQGEGADNNGASEPVETSTHDKEPKEEDKNNSTSNTTNTNIYSTALPAVGYVHLDKIQHREQQTIREAQAAAARIGVGVSSIGQDIFDALSKTLPCRWAKDSIVVMDEVIIAPPYEPENCKANASSSNSLARVKKVLEGERMRLASGRK
ncbi:anticodon-binding domain-containing protein [Dissophora ornata]|nr:anticodon-binding domain-containing protein [Dissophora ornata]